MNFIPGRIEVVGGEPAVRFGASLLPLGDGVLAGPPVPGRPVDLGIRPEQITIGAGAEFTWPATVDLREPLGGEVLLWTGLEGARIAIRTPSRQKIRDGETVTAGFNTEDLSVFDTETGARL
jgi:multiple sugar transport system ATP-binding protein